MGQTTTSSISTSAVTSPTGLSSTDLLFNHSVRVYLFAAEQGRQQRLRVDAELLYVAAAFHDLGLIKKFSSQDERFEVDGANAARQFLTAHNVPEEQVQTVWEAIALHTTPGIPQYMRPEVALLYSGVGLDVLGNGFDQLPSELRDEIVAKYPRKRFKEDFIQAYFAGFAHKPSTTYGTANAHGTVLVKEVFKTTTKDMTTGTASSAGTLAGWFVMVKDNVGRFSGNKLWGDGWGWSWFDATNPQKTTSTDYTTDCQSCHVPARQSDWIYTRGYPVLNR